MADEIDLDETSLWVCLHDGELSTFQHDPVSRVATLTWDVPHLMKFHDLPEETRFEMRLEEVKELQVSKFQVWPGATNSYEGLTWMQQDLLRRADLEKSVYTSENWQHFAESMETSEYECSNAMFRRTVGSNETLSLDLGNYKTNLYFTVRLNYKRLRLRLSSGRELPLEEFLSMGTAYWNDFAKRGSSNEFQGSER